jgi:hypothetical protein
MDEPWFRRWLMLGFYPIRWQGWALTALFWAIEYPVFFVWGAAEPAALFSRLCGVAGVVLFFIFFAIVVLKTERSYGR